MAGSAGTSAPARITTTRSACSRRWRTAAPGLRPRRGSQPRSRTAALSPATSSAGTSAPARITTTRSTSARPRSCWQRRDFGPGEDHNSNVGGSTLRLTGSAGTSAPARITTPAWNDLPPPSTCSAGTSAPARITTTARSPTSTRGPRAAPGLRPRRGSQLPAGRAGVRHGRGSAGTSAPARITTSIMSGAPTSRTWQRRDFGPGEDHNSACRVLVHEQVRQRRDFGPGEDHNLQGTPLWLDSAGGSAGTSAPARITTGETGPPSARAGGSAGTSAPARITTTTTGHSGLTTGQRRDFGPGEDHNGEGPWMGLTWDECSAGTSAPARITTLSTA